MHICRWTAHIFYIIDNRKLDVVNEKKEVAILLQIWNHPRSVRKNTLKLVLGMIGITITYKNCDILLPLYKTLVWPHLEYCSSVWSLTVLLNRYIKKVTGTCPASLHEDDAKFKPATYEKRLERLGLSTLEARRNRADLLEVFRMYKGWSTTSFDTLLSPHADRQGAWIYRLWFVCLFVFVFVRLRISQPMIKLAASNFERWFNSKFSLYCTFSTRKVPTQIFDNIDIWYCVLKPIRSSAGAAWRPICSRKADWIWN